MSKGDFTDGLPPIDRAHLRALRREYAAKLRESLQQYDQFLSRNPAHGDVEVLLAVGFLLERAT